MAIYTIAMQQIIRGQIRALHKPTLDVHSTGIPIYTCEKSSIIPLFLLSMIFLSTYIAMHFICDVVVLIQPMIDIS